MSELMKEVIIIRGASGSGKSTFAKLLIKMAGHGIICEADEFFEIHGKKFHYSLLAAAHEYCQEKFNHCVQLNAPLVIVSNTSTKDSEFKFYIDLAKERGYKVTSLVMENINGTKSIYNVPEHTLAKQKSRLLASIKL
jgi:uridine kinase